MKERKHLVHALRDRAHELVGSSSQQRQLLGVVEETVDDEWDALGARGHEVLARNQRLGVEAGL